LARCYPEPLSRARSQCGSSWQGAPGFAASYTPRAPLDRSPRSKLSSPSRFQEASKPDACASAGWLTKSRPGTGALAHPLPPTAPAYYGGQGRRKNCQSKPLPPHLSPSYVLRHWHVLLASSHQTRAINETADRATLTVPSWTSAATSTRTTMHGAVTTPSCDHTKGCGLNTQS
jgi:hypothetical protein